VEYFEVFEAVAVAEQALALAGALAAVLEARELFPLFVLEPAQALVAAQVLELVQEQAQGLVQAFFPDQSYREF
jgi:uncharacterized protein YmfQ (DUF2313 family)